MTNLIEQLRENGINFKINEPMKAHTTFRTGGNAKLFVIPEDVEQLKLVLRLCRKNGKDIFVLGNGSNLLVSDEGIIDKAVIYIGDSFSYIKDIDETTVEAGAGTNLAALCKYALSKSLTGLEFAFGIPGSTGGAAYMNAGAYGGEMKQVTIKCNHVDKNGNEGSFSFEELDFSYRHSVYSDNDFIITSIVLKLEKGEKEEIESKMTELLGRRKDKQPLEYPSAGSVFKRPEGYFAGALVEQSGLKGKTIGGAQVSEKHAGFIINRNNATTKDVTDLIKFCQDTVLQKFGVMLEPEIKVVN